MTATSLVTDHCASGARKLPLADVDAFVKAEHKRWGEVIRGARIKPE